ncbi:LexA family transcriptional regulator [Devosia riboflavina]
MASEQVERVKQLVESQKLNMKAISLAAGLGETFVRDMIKRDREPSAENLQRVMDAIARIGGRVPLDPVREVTPADIEPINRATLNRDIDVLGAAAGSEIGRGSFQFSLDPIDRVARPPGLVGVKNVYSVYVENDSMYPMYNDGDLVFANSTRPPRPGDAVIIQNPGDVEGDGVGGFIKILVRRTADWIECKQFNPPATLKFRNRPDLKLHRVYTNNELFGI